MTGDRNEMGLGGTISRLLDEHWPNSGVNGWYLADLLREAGVHFPPAQSAPEERP